jgi:hypothetical protein
LDDGYFVGVVVGKFFESGGYSSGCCEDIDVGFFEELLNKCEAFKSLS